MNTQTTLADIRGLTKRYGNKPALEDVHLQIPAGRIIGLLGPNGCGKTTLIKCMCGLIRDYDGSVDVLGQPRPACNLSISYLPEKTYLPDWMRPQDALQLFEDFYPDFDRARAQTLLQRMQLPEKQRLKAMSKGMQEKVQLILVMSRRARLYLLDEPLSGIDPMARDVLLDVIIQNYHEDATVLLSTHLIHDIERILDSAIFIKQGRIALQGDVDTLRADRNRSLEDIFKEVFAC